MVVGRINSLDIDHRELFTAIYGVNSTSEVYITEDLRVHTLNAALYLYLKEQGYTTVFFDEKVFSYEEQPLMEFLGLTAQHNTNTSSPTPPTPTPSKGKRDFFKGKGAMQSTRDMNKVNNSSTAVQPSAVGQTSHDAIQQLTVFNQRIYAVMKDHGFLKDMFAYVNHNPEKKAAVVFVSPDTLQLTPEQEKTYRNQWRDLRNNFRRNNIKLRVIALYDFPTPELFADKLKETSPSFLLQSPFKENILNDIGGIKEENFGADLPRGRTVFFMQTPGRDEIANLLNYRRLMTSDGLPHLFTKVKWDEVTLRLWQGGEMKTSKTGSKKLQLLIDMRDCAELDKIIECMDTEKAIDQLNAMQGIDNIKEQFASYRNAYARHRTKKEGPPFRPHMALMGSPGTGKTTVARLFGNILREDGLLPKGHFIKVSVDELVGEYVGHTRPKTRAVCERAKGGVLFIDEAYGLMSGNNKTGAADFGKEAIEVLIQFMEDNDDSLVILAGYTEEINYLLDHGNKGFRRRINDLGYFYFQDYNPDVLYNIASKMINVPVTESFKKALKAIIRYKHAYRNKKFGNAGDMENMMSVILSHYNDLNVDEPLDVKHLPNDLRLLVDSSMLNTDTLFAELNNIIGQEGVKALARKLFNKTIADRKRLRNNDNFHPTMPKLQYIFTGNPGTGKTTIARIIGNILRNLGIFPATRGNIVEEKSGNDLLTLSPDEMKNLFEDCIGKVLFIDEAYQLKESPRIVADIVGNTELPEYKNKMALVLAGYPEEIQAMLDRANPGTSSRFFTIPFCDYTNEELYEILVNKVASAPNTRMDTELCRDTALKYFAALPRKRGFGNARETENLLQILIENRDERYVAATDANPILESDIDFSERILPDDFPFTSTEQSILATTPIDKKPLTFSGLIDCSKENPSDIVSSGKDIYNSVGLIESSNGSGTGFIISKSNRYIMTASHVVEGNSGFTFTLNMQQDLFQTQAHVLWNNFAHDFAIMQVDALPQEAMCFKIDVETPRDPGTELCIAAFPMGTQVSAKVLLTKGGISNYESNLQIRNNDGNVRTFNAIRTEAQATHGSSGGPVVLADSMKVIGVLHGGMKEEGFFMNIASDTLQLFQETTLNIRI